MLKIIMICTRNELSIGLHTDCLISAHRPDIVIVHNYCRTGILIDVAIPADANIITKESEK